MANNKTKRTDILSVDPRNIVIEEGFNSRRDFGDIEKLARQIDKNGLKNPLHVQKVVGEEDKFILVDGERRYRAIQLLLAQGKDIPYVRCIVVPTNATKEELYLEQAMANEGKPFNEYEKGVLAKKLHDECGMSYAEIGRKFGDRINTGCVQYWVEIFDWPEKFQVLVRDGKISGSNMRRIMKAHVNGKDENGKNTIDFEGAWKEIEKLQKNAEDNGEHVLHLKSLSNDFDSKTKVTADTKVIAKGIETLQKYTAEYKKRGAHLTMNMADLLQALKSGKLITEILEESVPEQYRQAV